MSDQRQHAVNGLHVYCRLRDVCVPKNLARLLAWCWERLIHRLIYRGRP